MMITALQSPDATRVAPPAPAGRPDMVGTSRRGTADGRDVSGPLISDGGDRSAWARQVWRDVEEAGLLGRGGAGFPAAVKWRAVHGRRSPTVVVNAMEGEPASAKDRVLLVRRPHLVLQGAEVLALVVGAHRVVVCVADGDDEAAASVERAIGERAAAGRARSEVPPVAMTVRRPPARYVTGEESALAAWLDGRPARPTLRVDKSVPLQVGRRPMIVHNAETLWQVALVARWRSEGGHRSGGRIPVGTTLVTMSGALSAPGVYEAELGTPVVDLLRVAGVEGPPIGVLLGGYGGAWLGPDRLDTPYAAGPLHEAGTTPGSGVVVVLGAASCGIAESARIAGWMAGESAGQCGPCVFGLPALAADLQALAAGRAGAEAIERLGQRADVIEGRGACRHPDGVVRMVRSALRAFAEDASSHAEGRPCAAAAPSVLTFR